MPASPKPSLNSSRAANQNLLRLRQQLYKPHQTPIISSWTLSKFRAPAGRFNRSPVSIIHRRQIRPKRLLRQRSNLHIQTPVISIRPANPLALATHTLDRLTLRNTQSPQIWSTRRIRNHIHLRFHTSLISILSPQLPLPRTRRFHPRRLRFGQEPHPERSRTRIISGPRKTPLQLRTFRHLLSRNRTSRNS